MRDAATSRDANRRGDRALAAAGICLICGYFLLLARSSLDVFFTPDDCMNLYRSWIRPASALIKANLLFFMASPFQRPLGSVFYAFIYHFTGFHATWFHIVALAFLTANIPLTYAAARRLSGSRLAALLTALFACYEGRFTSLYFDTGFIYDVLCYFFTLAALLVYLRARQTRRKIGAWEAVLLVVLFVCGLNSKEVAVMLPLFLVIYEALYHPPDRYSLNAVIRWIWSDVRLPMGLCLVSIVFVIGRSLGPDTLITDEMYRPMFTWQRFMQTNVGFLNTLFAVNQPFTSGLALYFWGVTLLAAVLRRSRALAFAWLFAMTSALPLDFVQPRGGPQYYLPLFGWSLYAGILMARGAAWLARIAASKLSFRAERAGAAGLFFVLAALLYSHYRGKELAGLSPVVVEAPLVRSIADQLHRLYPELPRGSRILFLNDPYPANWENMIFVVRLSYNDDTLLVERVKKMTHPPTEADLATYNYVLDYRAGRFTEGSGAPGTTYPPSIAVSSLVNDVGVAEAYHGADWEPVTAANPARPGERIILKAMDLGATNPENPLGRQFPSDPLARVVAAVNAKVNARAAAVEEKLGWPGEVNTYRVDIRLPQETGPGLARIELSEEGVISAPAVLRVGR